MDEDKILVDTSVWLSFILINDRDHRKVNNLLGELRKKGAIVYTTNDIVDETVTRLIYDSNFGVAKKFIAFLGQGIKEKTIVQYWTDEQIQDEAFVVLEKFKDHKLSLTDATSVVIMKRFHLDTVLTLDLDFKKIGIPSLP